MHFFGPSYAGGQTKQSPVLFWPKNSEIVIIVTLTNWEEHILQNKENLEDKQGVQACVYVARSANLQLEQVYKEFLY